MREEKEEAVSEWTLKLSIDGQLCYRIFIFINPHDVGLIEHGILSGCGRDPKLKGKWWWRWRWRGYLTVDGLLPRHSPNKNHPFFLLFKFNLMTLFFSSLHFLACRSLYETKSSVISQNKAPYSYRPTRTNDEGLFGFRFILLIDRTEVGDKLIP